MKQLLRALGVGAALLLPITGLSFIDSGIAGASTKPISFEVTFTFLGPTIAVSSSCPQTTIVLLRVVSTMKGIPVWYKNTQNTYQILCTSSGTVGHGVPATGVDYLLLTKTGFLLSSTSNTINFWKYTPVKHTGVNFKLVFGTTTCTVSFTGTILFHKVRTVYRATAISTATTIITATTTTTGICTSIAAVLHTPTASFSGRITLL